MSASTTDARRPSREQCITNAGAWFAAARARRDALPIKEAARRALRAGGPTLAEIEHRIATQRGALARSAS